MDSSGGQVNVKHVEMVEESGAPAGAPVISAQGEDGTAKDGHNVEGGSAPLSVR